MESSGAPVPLNIGEGVVGKETEVTERETVKSANWEKKKEDTNVRCPLPEIIAQHWIKGPIFRSISHLNLFVVSAVGAMLAFGIHSK